ncbi:hypothetical protein E2C01_065586 [Portunus trituberculatus]|uniref:Uncharacterized protein n=1 Tax=Portunus trituberculatus TaxID=210409 RepID=A0A5B7HJ87_PORTR|nr:hypothetical protein [Portunus trituberculatus]
MQKPCLTTTIPKKTTLEAASITPTTYSVLKRLGTRRYMFKRPSPLSASHCSLVNHNYYIFPPTTTTTTTTTITTDHRGVQSLGMTRSSPQRPPRAA